MSYSLDQFVLEHRLPSEFVDTVNRHYLPLAERLSEWLAGQPEFVVIGINGAQGTGKSTLSDFLVQYLTVEGFAVANLSLDDLYLTRAERVALSEDVHPLLATRGVPGTHDVGLGLEILEQLRVGADVELPKFDKAADDRQANIGEKTAGPLKAIILEGWCLGVRAEPAVGLANPVNDLEAAEDPDGVWRRWVNEQLEKQYPALFGQIDKLIFLQAPSFDAILRWRTEQEHKLAQASQGMKTATKIMSDAQVRRFIQHYERLTNACLQQLPGAADVVVTLNEAHGVDGVTYNTDFSVSGASK